MKLIKQSRINEIAREMAKLPKQPSVYRAHPSIPIEQLEEMFGKENVFTVENNGKDIESSDIKDFN